MEFCLCLLCSETKASWLHALSKYSPQKRTTSAGTSTSGKTQGKERDKASVRHLLLTFKRSEKKNTYSDTGKPHPLLKNSQIKELEISQLVVSSRYLHLPPITTLSTLLQPFLDGRSAQKHCNSQPLTTRRKKIRKVPLTSDRKGATCPTKNVMSKPPYTALLRARILARADCTHDAQRNTT